MCAYDQPNSQSQIQPHAIIQLALLTGMFTGGAWICTPTLAHAYIGVTLSTGALMIIGLVSFSILIALYVLVWFPIRRRLKRRRSSEVTQDEADSHEFE